MGIIGRSAEGYVRHWFAVLGAMLVAGLWVPFYGSQVGTGRLYGTPVLLPEKFGWGGALFITLSVLTLFYFFAAWIEFRKKRIRKKGGVVRG